MGSGLDECMKRHSVRRRSARAGFLTLWVAIALSVAFVHPVAADVDISATKFHGIVVDGFADDWATVPGTTLTLIRPLATSERLEGGLTLKVVYDDANLYVLVLIEDDFDYNATDHHLSGALAVLWQIDPAATPDMGGGLGNVDIWHWELDTGPGVPAGGPNYTGGNDPVGNFDDEWSSSVTDRFDDDLANELYGVWSHTNMSAQGAPGTWIFEMRRTLTTGDTLDQDRQFTVNETVGMAIAYWDADETPTGWTAAGHYASCRDPDTLDFSWIMVTLEPVVLPQGPPGPEGPAGPEGPQGEEGPAGPTDVSALAAGYAGLGLSIAAVVIAVVAMKQLRRGRT